MKKTPQDESAVDRPVMDVCTSQQDADVMQPAIDILGLSVNAKAPRIVKTMNKIYLTHTSANKIFNTLNNSPAPSAQLLAAAKRYKERAGIN